MSSSTSSGFGVQGRRVLPPQARGRGSCCGGRGGDERGARSFDPGCPDGSALDVHVLMDIQSAAFVTVKAKMTRYMVSYPLPCEGLGFRV